jgi:hypothetical protein
MPSAQSAVLAVVVGARCLPRCPIDRSRGMGPGSRPGRRWKSHDNLVQLLAGMLGHHHRDADRHRDHQHGDAEKRQRERSRVLLQRDGDEGEQHGTCRRCGQSIRRDAAHEASSAAHEHRRITCDAAPHLELRACAIGRIPARTRWDPIRPHRTARHSDAGEQGLIAQGIVV